MIFNLTQPVLDSAPKFTYTGTYEYIDDGEGNWRIKFLSSGTFTPLKDMTIDAFLVGGGGGGVRQTSRNYYCGGAGGYTTTRLSIVLSANTEYPIEVGAGGPGLSTTSNTDSATSGGTSSGFGASASGGNGAQGASGGSGGSGGGGRLSGSIGGSDGSDGSGTYPGTGQGTTTREFGESTGSLYSTGGDAVTDSNNTPADNNTGDGGHALAAGGSGIVVIRKHKEAAA